MKQMTSSNIYQIMSSLVGEKNWFTPTNWSKLTAIYMIWNN